MQSHRTEWAKYLKDTSLKPSPINKIVCPSTTCAIAQVLSTWLGYIIEWNGFLPDKNGVVTFEVAYNDILAKGRIGKISQSLRKYLRNYGFQIRKTSKAVVEVQKHL